MLAKAIVDKPDEVIVDAKTDEMGVLLTLHVAEQDIGQVIGRLGSTATAMRALLRIVGIKEGARVNMKISDPSKDNA